MHLREIVNEHPRSTMFVCIALILIVVALMYKTLRSSGTMTAGSPRAFFTVDDGATWFADDVSKLPPFEHQGKFAVRACVFECDGKQFVNYLERYTPEARKALLEARQSDPASKDAAKLAFNVQRVAVDGREFKRPGDREWVRSTDFAAIARITSSACPHGNGVATAVIP